MEYKGNSHFKGVAYLRISKENKLCHDETNTIGNQRCIIKEFLVNHPEIKLIQTRVDDGYTGTDFERPGFRQMLADMDNGANCIIVKDLSRLGRNYIGCGKYIERQFKSAGIRFISVADQIDTFSDNENMNSLMMPFKNLMNEMLSAGLSSSVRSHLDARRTDGQNTGAFAVYGYKKESSNLSQLVVDRRAAETVQKIYWLRSLGMSMMAIAHYLNCFSIPTPLDYKRSAGSNFKTSFQIYREGTWEAMKVKRILTNRVYTGRLEQKKTTTVDYKHKERVHMPKEKWICSEASHEAVISKTLFETVQLLNKVKQNIPCVPNESLLVGIAKCGNCGNLLSYQAVPGKCGKYRYYMCKSCAGTKKPIRIRADDIESCVLRVLNSYLLNRNEPLSFSVSGERKKKELAVIEDRKCALLDRKNELSSLLLDIQGDIAAGILDEEDAPELELICKKELDRLNQDINFLNDSRIYFTEGDRIYEPETGFLYLTQPITMLFISEIQVKSKSELIIVLGWNEKQGNIVHT